ncbi:hypothetical protein K443DRAFT_85935, partial [Laccaria amethystina LaAM-08-1]
HSHSLKQMFMYKQGRKVKFRWSTVMHTAVNGKIMYENFNLSKPSPTPPLPTPYAGNRRCIPLAYDRRFKFTIGLCTSPMSSYSGDHLSITSRK